MGYTTNISNKIHLNRFQGIVLKNKKKIYLDKKLLIKDILPNQILVKIKYSGLCGSQIMEINGLRGKDKYFPHLLGHEGFGKVVSIGKKVKKFNIGDEVILSWIKGKGSDSGGGSISNIIEKINHGPITTFNKYSLISENRCFKKPIEMSKKIAVLFGCCIPTGVGMIINELIPKKNKTFLLSGLGSVGLSSFVALKLFQPKLIVAIDKKNSKLAILQNQKNVKTIRLKDNLKNFNKKVLKLNNDEKFDYSVDCSGSTSSIERSFKLIKNNGKLIYASHPKKGDKIRLDPYDLIKGKKIKGSWGGNSKLDSDIEKIYKMHKNKKINLNFIPTNIYKLGNFKQAIKDYNIGKVSKVIFENY